MNKEKVEHFFRELSKEWKHPVEISLLGGAAALLMGGARPTLDVDFEVRFLSEKASWEKFQQAVQRVTQKTGLGAQCAESIERWSQLTLMDYRKHTKPVGVFGAIRVRILEPEYWSIGKVGRYWDQDVQDMLVVFKRHKPDPMKLARLWAKAIAKSPKSTQLALVRRQALHFFQTFGKQIWGDPFPLESIQKLFQL